LIVILSVFDARNATKGGSSHLVLVKGCKAIILNAMTFC
jgi:hypothetical protein